MSLKDVIRKLSEGPSDQYVPYRDNKLTQLMRDSIGGNSKTLMFVNISPADYNSQESKMSLIFAENAKKIKNNVSKNVESKEVAKLKDEVNALRRQLNIGASGTQAAYGGSQSAAAPNKNGSTMQIMRQTSTTASNSNHSAAKLKNASMQ